MHIHSSEVKVKVKVKPLSRVWLLATPWTAAYQAPPSMGFSRQEYWSGVSLPFSVYTVSLCLLHTHTWSKRKEYHDNKFKPDNKENKLTCKQPVC